MTTHSENGDTRVDLGDDLLEKTALLTPISEKPPAQRTAEIAVLLGKC